MKQTVLKILGGALAGIGLLFILGAGPVEIPLPLSGLYRGIQAGDGSFASSTGICDGADPTKCVSLGQNTMANSIPVAIPSDQSPVNTGTHTLTSQQAAPGTNGFTVTPFNVLTTELNALANAGVATSSVNGTSGVFSQTNTGNALFGRCWLKLGAALGGVAVSGANVSVWFLASTDGGTTFESQTVSPPPRAPDIIIPLGASAYGANAILMSPARVNLWLASAKIVLQNNTGQALGASGNILTCASQAVQQ